MSMKLSEKLLRSVVLIGGISVLLWPSLVMALAYTSVDLNVAAVAVLICMLAATRAPKFKWVCALVASFLIAVPPYPYWLSRDTEHGWYIRPFYGFSLQNTPLLQFLVTYVVALAVFTAMFWAAGRTAKARR
jgi:hypothetical protein